MNLKHISKKIISKSIYSINSWIYEFKPENSADQAAKIIYDTLMSEEPCMIARFGANELTCVCNYININNKNKIINNFINGNLSGWWWDENNMNNMYTNAGFFPNNIDNLEKFSKLMLNDIPYIDILGSWLQKEIFFQKELRNRKKINLELLNPFFSKIPWTTALKGKKVLVIHPFANSITNQFKKKNLIFQRQDILPDFELKIVKAVQSIAGNKTNFIDWFEALDYMKNEINKIDYDICLIGCGAYGFPLAAHVKRMGKKAVHLGGSLQLLFGIKGKRWERTDYNVLYNYSSLINEHWIKSADEEKPELAIQIENECYW